MKKNVRAFLCLFGAVLVLCIVLSAITEERSSLYFIHSWFVDPFVFYIPFAVGTVGIFLWLVGLFFENGVQKKLRISASVAFAVTVLCALTAIYALGRIACRKVHCKSVMR